LREEVDDKIKDAESVPKIMTSICCKIAKEVFPYKTDCVAHAGKKDPVKKWSRQRENQKNEDRIENQDGHRNHGKTEIDLWKNPKEEK
jgi:hypothetical protein